MQTATISILVHIVMINHIERKITVGSDGRIRKFVKISLVGLMLIR